MDVQKTWSSSQVWRILSVSIIGTLAGGVALAQQKAMPEETVFSSSLRFQGEVVEVLPSGQAI